MIRIIESAWQDVTFSCTTVSAMQCFMVIHESSWCYPMIKLFLIIIHDTTWHFFEDDHFRCSAGASLSWCHAERCEYFSFAWLPRNAGRATGFQSMTDTFETFVCNMYLLLSFQIYGDVDWGLFDSPWHKHHPSLLWVCQPFKPLRFVNQQYRIASEVIKNAKAHAK